MNALAICHIVIGSIGIIVFMLTGHYMDSHLNHLQGMSDGPRMLYRSSHIYFLLSCIINLCIALSVQKKQSYIRICISLIILIAPILLLIGFFIEPTLSNFDRPYTRPALYALFGAGILLVFINLKNQIIKK